MCSAQEQSPLYWAAVTEELVFTIVHIMVMLELRVTRVSYTRSMDAIVYPWLYIATAMASAPSEEDKEWVNFGPVELMFVLGTISSYTTPLFRAKSPNDTDI